MPNLSQPRGKRRQTAPRRRLWLFAIAWMPQVIVDVGGGYGGGVTIRLKDNGMEPVSFVASWESIEKTKEGQLAFANKRAEVWWKFREALDPDQPDGSAIALPPDPELRADLCAPMETRRSGHSARKQRRKQRFWKPRAPQ